ncbi:hypothetical protein HRbin26_01415 [bacterium HR26]|nr:hypothetical protein HRbin26_01415 [bacterium HR26]
MLGHLDDLVLVPLLVVLAIRMIPREVLAESQAAAAARLAQGRGIGLVGAGLVVASWFALAALVVLFTVQAFR